MFPKLYLAKQTFPRPRVEDIKSTVYQELEKLGIRKRLPKGAKVAITAGSRGINRIVEITRITVEYLKENGFEPRLIAAMGSHGGGTAEGQREILNSLGMTAEAVGAPVLTGAETVEVGKTPQGLTAYINRHVLRRRRRDCAQPHQGPYRAGGRHAERPHQDVRGRAGRSERRATVS